MALSREELREFILSKFPIKNGKLTTDPVRWCNRNCPDIAEQIIASSEYDTLTDAIYSILLDRTNRCEVCNKLISHGWMTRDNKYCSRKCMTESAEWRGKYKETMTTRYGVDSPLKSAVIKEQARQTSRERYGADNPAQSAEIIDKITKTFQERYGVDRAVQFKEFRDKQNKTNMDRYGTINPLSNPDIRTKRNETMLAKYGTIYPLQVKEFKEKSRATTLANHGVDNIFKKPSVHAKSIAARYGIPLTPNPVADYLDSKRIDKHDIIVHSWVFGLLPDELLQAQANGTITTEELARCVSDVSYARRKLGMPAEYFVSIPQQILIDWLGSIGIEVVVNDRTVIKPKEIDIWIPSHNLAIEVNGLYWHSTTENCTRHIEKFAACRENGIGLLQFTDADIRERLDLVKSMILSKLGLLPNKIMARKCNVVDVPRTTAQSLLASWHYQGKTTQAAKFIGLDYQDKIVAVIGYTISNDTIRIERFACELFTNVVGGYSRLEKAIINRHNPSQLVTFSLGLISDGSLYAKSGYDCGDGYQTKPEWYVTDYLKLYNRQQFMKHKLKGVLEVFDPDKTERQNILDNGYRLYFGAGITKWVKQIR